MQTMKLILSTSPGMFGGVSLASEFEFVADSIESVVTAAENFVDWHKAFMQAAENRLNEQDN